MPREQPTRAIIIALLIIAVAAIGLLLAAIASVQLRDTVIEGELSRHAEPRILMGGGTSKIDLVYQPTTSASCAQENKPTNIILLVDKSGSMNDNDAFAEALSALEVFINNIDTVDTQVALVFFDDQPILAQPPTTNVAALQAADVGVEPQGGTDFFQALTFVDELTAEFGDSSSAETIVVILTDGEAPDPNLATSKGQELKSAGIRVVTVGTGHADSRFLMRLASNPSDYHDASSAAELSSIYAEIAAQLNDVSATDVRLVEAVNERLVVIEDSLSPTGAIDTNTITWDIVSLPQQGGRFSYEVNAQRIGLHNINAGETTMFLIDCLAGPMNLTFIGGPSLLVLPPVWAGLLLCLLPLLTIPLLFWNRRQSREPEQGTQARTPPPPTDADLMPDPVPAWVKRLDEAKILADDIIEQPDEELAPTLIIGVGPVGRIVLSQIAQTLHSRYGETLPEDIKLLQIDVQLESSREDLIRPEHLAEDQWVRLSPDLSEVERNLLRSPDKWPHLKWYAESAPGYERTRGRMALFYDLQDGADRSVLWQGLSRAASGLNHPKLKLVGSTFDDSSSGMLIDVARIVQIITRSDVDVELWLSLPVGQDWSPRLSSSRQKVKSREQITRTLATLRELERFQRNAVVPFYYVPSDNIQTELHDDAHFAVVQTLFLFEPPEGNTSVEDHLTTLADALLALLHVPAQQAIGQHLSGNQARATTLTNNEGIGMVCSVGAFSVRLPSSALDDALAWRMVYELLFDTQIGLVPIATLQSNGSYVKRTVEEYDDDSLMLRSSAEKFVQNYRGKYNSQLFRASLAKKIGELLNGEDREGEPTLTRCAGLIQAHRWLQSARAILNREGEIEVSRALLTLESQLDGWQNFLVESVHPIVEERMSQANSVVAELPDQLGRQWVLDPELGWGVYTQRIRPWVSGLPSNNVAGEPLLRAAQRFGWLVDYNEVSRQWNLKLISPPGKFTWHPQIDLLAYGLDRDAYEVADKIYHLAHPLARGKSTVRERMVMDVAESINPTIWLDKAEPRLDYNRQEASERMGGGTREVVLLIAPKSERSKRLQDSLRSTSSRPIVRLIETEDETAVTVLRVRDRIPVYTSEKYGELTWETQVVTPAQYAWRGEQMAAEMERDSDLLSTIFVGWLERDKDLLDRFCHAYLLGLLEQHQSLFDLPGLGSWPGNTIGEALANLVSVDGDLKPEALRRQRDRERAIETLDDAIKRERDFLWQEVGRASYLEQATERLIDPLRSSSDLRENDLAIYLLGVVSQF